jgi:hypothetical protein
MDIIIELWFAIPKGQLNQLKKNCEGSDFPELEDFMLLISLPARIHDRFA